MMVSDEHTEECDICQEAFSGQRFINAYLWEYEDDNEAFFVCVSCIKKYEIKNVGDAKKAREEVQHGK